MDRAANFAKLLGLMLLGNGWIQLVNFLITKNAGRCTSVRLLWMGGACLIVPASYLFLYTYSFGYVKASPGHIWPVQITAWSAGIATALFMAWIVFRQLPNAQALIAIAALSIALLAISWR